MRKLSICIYTIFSNFEKYKWPDLNYKIDAKPMTLMINMILSLFANAPSHLLNNMNRSKLSRY